MNHWTLRCEDCGEFIDSRDVSIVSDRIFIRGPHFGHKLSTVEL